jgi:hypothetical protein
MGEPAEPLPVRIPEIDRHRGPRSKLAVSYRFDESGPQWEPGSPVGLFLQAIRTGAYPDQAAEFARLTPAQVRRWLNRGAAVYPEDADDLALMDDPDRMYAAFYSETRAREATVGVEMIGVWRKQAVDDWRAAKDFMARRFKSDWAPKEQIEHSGPDGGPVQVEGLVRDGLFGDPQIAELLRNVEEKLSPRSLEPGSAEPFDIEDAEVIEDSDDV